MSSLERGLRHMAWANDALFDHLATLPAHAFGVSYVPEAWGVGRLTVHLVGSVEWFRYCLNGTRWTDMDRDWTAADVLALRPYLAELEATLLLEAEKPDGLVTFEDEEGPKTFQRSTILTQAVVHAAEHRAQIAVALEVNGYPKFDLDLIDLWAFEVANK